jgi:hypothetical protein
MNFPSSSNCFCIKNEFLILFLYFNHLWTGRVIKQKCRGPGVKDSKTQGAPDTDGGLIV